MHLCSLCIICTKPTHESFRELYYTARFSQSGPATKLPKSILSVFAAPGFILETIPSQYYSIGFALAISTRLPPDLEMTGQHATSGSIKVTQTVGGSLRYQLTVFPLLTSSNNIGAAPCVDGIETRITKIGAPASFACNCPPSTTCGEKAVCVVSPNSGEEWFSAKVPKDLCKQDQPSISRIDSLAGVVLGLFLLGCAAAYCCYCTTFKGKMIVATFQPLHDTAA